VFPPRECETCSKGRKICSRIEGKACGQCIRDQKRCSNVGSESKPHIQFGSLLTVFCFVVRKTATPMPNLCKKERGDHRRGCRADDFNLTYSPEHMQGVCGGSAGDGG